MRRALAIVFFLCAVAGGVWLVLRPAAREPAASQGPPPAAAPEPPPPPHLALPRAPPPSDAERPARPAVAQDEKALMRQVRALVKTEPRKAEALAREARRRFPNGAEADERDALLVDALINQQRIGAARDETYYYFERHPNGRFAEHLFVMTGARPAPRRP
ncbi:MAG: hypothetical protein JXP73_10165 [Deltaproteobacteria bacterium]|nr:hypothetical protein [Deltaproteobacteria bacterium]